MAQWRKVFAVKPSDLSSNLGTHMVELTLTCTCALWHVPTHMHIKKERK